MPITVEQLRKLGVCWSDEQLAKAAESWPAPASRLWSWWLGDRLDTMERADSLLRVHVAAAYAKSLQLTINTGALVKFARKCSGDQLARTCRAFGLLLDDPTDGNALDALRAVLQEPLPAPTTAATTG